MPAQDITYIEHYAGERQSAVDCFVPSLGLTWVASTWVAESSDSAEHSVLSGQGARGLRSANIKALYEAAERDGLARR